MMSVTIRESRPTAIQLPSPTGSNYDEEWTIKLQAGLTYHSVELQTNLQNVKTIKKVTLDIGGTPVVYSSNAMMDLIDKMYKKFQATGRFVFDFSKFEYRTPQGIFQTQLVTGIRDDVTLKVEFGAKGTTAGGAAADDPTKPTMTAMAYVTDTDRAGRVYMPSRYELTQHAAAAGTHTWEFPNAAPNKYVQRLVLDESEVTINKVIVKRGNRTLETLKRTDIDYALQRHGDVALQSGFLLLDFTLFKFGTNGAVNTHELKFEFEVSGTGAIKTYVEGFDQVKALPQRNA
jgi:hypothetical protein